MRSLPLIAGLSALWLAAPLAAEPFTPEQRDALKAEIRSYLLENPEILNEMVALLEEQRMAETAETDRALVTAHEGALFEDGFSFVGGNPEGSVTIVEFLDYQCGYCRRAHPDLMRLLDDDGDIRWIVKEIPILGPASEQAARATVATLILDGDEAYEALNDRLMRHDGGIDEAVLAAALEGLVADPAAVLEEMNSPEVTRRLQETQQLAQALEVSGTPTFVIGDRMVRGYVPLERMREIVDAERADG